MTQNAFFIPDEGIHGRKVSLSKSISAIQLVPRQDAGADMKLGLGLLSQLGPGVVLEVCGDGFDERTVMVRTSGHCYFVFSQDIEAAQTAAAN
jgi:hypothetical protein